jgi:hypothetical protein
MAARLIYLSLVFSSIFARAESLEAFTGGSPVPWPFPWAKDCPIQWSNLIGRYTLVDNSNGEEVSIRISFQHHRMLHVLRITRYDRSGHLLSDGYSFITENQKVFRVYLRPFSPDERPYFATIRLYYSDPRLVCGTDSLVPILSLVELQSGVSREVQYRMIRR